MEQPCAGHGSHGAVASQFDSQDRGSRQQPAAHAEGSDHHDPTTMMTREEVSEIFHKMDLNGDGEVSMIEFIKALRYDAALAERLQLPSISHQEHESRHIFLHAFDGMAGSRARAISLEEFVDYFERKGRIKGSEPPSSHDEWMARRTTDSLENSPRSSSGQTTADDEHAPARAGAGAGAGRSGPSPRPIRRSLSSELLSIYQELEQTESEQGGDGGMRARGGGHEADALWPEHARPDTGMEDVQGGSSGGGGADEVLVAVPAPQRMLRQPVAREHGGGHAAAGQAHHAHASRMGEADSARSGSSGGTPASNSSASTRQERRALLLQSLRCPLPPCALRLACLAVPALSSASSLAVYACLA